MMKIRKKKTLADSISTLLSAAPSYNSDEASESEETAAKVVDFDSDDDEHVAHSVKSDIRRQNVSLLDELDERYSGRRASRKELKDDEESDNDQLGYIDQEASSSEDEENNEKEDSSNEEAEEVEKSVPFNYLNNNNVETLTKKAHCVQQQINMWENLVEIRIQFQKCLVASNKLPYAENFKIMNEDSEFTAKAETVTSTLSHLISNMLELQTCLIKQYPESKNVLKRKQSRQENEESSVEDEDNEEIASDSEDEAVSAKKVKRKTTNELETEIESLHTSYTPFRNQSIHHWNDKTQIVESKNAKAKPVLNQIEHNLQDRQRLVKRTQLMRSEYRILGTNPIQDEYNCNIFDDDDFYHQLLRELIQVKSADITDPIQLSRQWIQLQNMRNKMKRKIDTRATKGRRIRYGVHTKLLNFMAPVEGREGRQRDDADLFQSVFGTR